VLASTNSSQRVRLQIAGFPAFNTSAATRVQLKLSYVGETVDPPRSECASLIRLQDLPGQVCLFPSALPPSRFLRQPELLPVGHPCR
jgi:hypothetical protein